MEKAPPDLELITRYFNGLTSRQMEQFSALKRLYLEWNSRINVISRKDIGSLYERHVLHSLSIAAINAFRPGSAVIDIGTGGGFPGIPLAILFPEAGFHLVDSISKKLKVVKEIAAAAGIENVTTEHARAETIKNCNFDYAVSRAVAPLKELWQWSKPLLTKNGVSGQFLGTTVLSPDRPTLPAGLICLKGGDLTAEIVESGARPHITDVHAIFREAFFRDKFIVFIPL